MHTIRTMATFVVLLLTTFASATAQSADSKMQNGDYIPGLVLVYNRGTLTPAKPELIDYSEHTYVLFHGAHNKSENLRKLCEPLRKTDPDCNILFVDWGYFAKFSEDRFTDILGEQVEEFVVELLSVEFLGWLLGASEEDMDNAIGALIVAHLAKLAVRVALNYLPVEQTSYIPSMATRANILLFSEKGVGWDLETNGVKASAKSLGLDPKKTAFIGHSHGAHLAGMTAKYCRKDRSRIKFLIALEPSPEATHTSGENSNGNGWDRNVADFAMGMRTSRFLCAEKTYADFNVYFKSSDHPFDRLENQSEKTEIIDQLVTGFKYECELHTKVIDLFAGMLTETDVVNDFWDMERDSSSDDTAKGWMEVGPDGVL